jgi:hypothetical protein
MYSPTASTSARPYKGIAYPGKHVAIVDQRAWDKAHAVMAELAPPTRCRDPTAPFDSRR